MPFSLIAAKLTTGARIVLFLSSKKSRYSNVMHRFDALQRGALAIETLEYRKLYELLLTLTILVPFWCT